MSKTSLVFSAAHKNYLALNSEIIEGLEAMARMVPSEELARDILEVAKRHRKIQEDHSQLQLRIISNQRSA